MNITKYFTFDYKIKRTEFWVSMIVFAVVSVILQQLSVALIDPTGAIAFLVALAFILPNVSIYKARLNDAGWSGWWMLLPVLNVVVAGFFKSEDDS